MMRMRLCGESTGVLAIVVGISVFGSAAASETAGAEPASVDVTVEQIVRAWNARHDRIRSLRFKVTDETVLVLKKLTLRHEREVIVDGDRLRHDKRGDDWIDEAKAVLPQRVVAIFDGEEDVIFFGREPATDRVHPLGFIHAGTGEKAGYSEAFSNSVWPIFHTFRIRQPRFLAPDAAGWRLTGRVGMVNGRVCPIIEPLSSAERGHLYHVWVDPQRGFIALRKQTGKGTQVRWQLDIDYVYDTSGEWVPSQWIDHHHAEDLQGGLVLVETAKYAVTDYALNPRIDDSAFEFEFPPGTLVRNTTSGSAESHVVRTSGIRPITDEELWRGARYSDFMSTDTGEALLPPSTRWFRWWWLLVAGGLAAAGWFVIKGRSIA